MESILNKFLPVIPLRNTVVLPGTTLPLTVGRPKSIQAIAQAKNNDNWIIVIAQKSDLEGREPGVDDLYHVGTLAKIEQVRGSAKQGYQVVIRGESRVNIEQFRDESNFLAAMGTELEDKLDTDEATLQALTANIKLLANDILHYIPSDTRQVAMLLEAIEDPALLMHLCAEHLGVPVAKKQEILELVSLKHRALKLLELMQTQRESLKIQSEIREKLSEKMGKHQREAILREQLRTIREELGEGDGGDGDDYFAKIEAAEMPDEAKKVALEEAKRLAMAGNSSPESHVIRNYLDLMVQLPWNKGSTDEIDLEKARSILNGDHFGLEKIKRRIVQHLAVMKKRGGGKGTILLFVGPPGVGKTSLGQSIATAIGREFSRVSLGGVRDDSEVRGHRRTYIGAMPGRIIQGIKRSGVNNPVLMLDEIDKLGRGYTGDPSSALLEVLDPEQNKKFSDHYLEVPFDLSNVFFIATANSLETIPAPLLDRMEVIELSGYTTAEKVHIAKNHLLPKQLAEHGLVAGDLILKDDALLRTITHYTREAGVRDLQRKIATISRASTEKVIEAENALPITVRIQDLDEILGPERFQHEVAERIAPPGVVTGLAWTPMGGEILFIEAQLMPGKGQLTLTGQLGEVMKESAQIALSIVRSSLSELVPGFEFDKKDIHVHVPAGAIPKDGPSAGVTMLTTLASLFTKRSVSPKLAMTGEVTLRGAVMPVGGIKEKVIAAHRAGIEKVILSKRNEKDLRDVPAEVRDQLQFVFVETATEVLKEALGIEVPESLATQNVASRSSFPSSAVS